MWKFAIGAVAGVAALTTLFLRPAGEEIHPVVAQKASASTAAVSSPPQFKLPQSAAVSHAVVSTDYGKALAATHDYWDYARSILSAAKSGNPDAQYYLAQVLERCKRDNKMYFQQSGANLTLDQGIQRAVRLHLSLDMANAIYERCRGFAENDSADLGDASDWLAQAAASQQPLAQATTALKLITQEVLHNAQLAGAVANPEAPAWIDTPKDTRQLLREAVESRNPEVLYMIGEAQGFLSAPNTDVTVPQFAWWLVACERGLDCSANAEWVKIGCASDPRCASFTDPSDFVRTFSGDEWNDVRLLAQQINANLDAGRWDELGLGE